MNAAIVILLISGSLYLLSLSFLKVSDQISKLHKKDEIPIQEEEKAPASKPIPASPLIIKKQSVMDLTDAPREILANFRQVKVKDNDQTK